MFWFIMEIWLALFFIALLGGIFSFIFKDVLPFFFSRKKEKAPVDLSEMESINFVVSKEEYEDAQVLFGKNSKNSKNKREIA